MAGAAISNPHLGTDAEGGWSMGFAWGFVGPGMSIDPPLVIAPELFDAFNEGVLAGQQAAIEGLNVGVECVSLEQETSPTAEALMEGFHVFESIGIIRSWGHWKHFTVEVLFLGFLFLIPGPPPLDPAAEFNQKAIDVQFQLASFGLGSGSFFVGAGIDEQTLGCQLLFTPVFRDADQARDALLALGRPNWVLAEWNASMPMSGGVFRVIDSA